MAGDLCLKAFSLECLLICVSAYCRINDQSEKCVSPKEFICVPDECGNPTYVCEDQFPVESGKCPYFNKLLQKMDVTECTAGQVCPSEPYLASDLIQKSKDCLANPKRTNRCLDQKSKSTTEITTGLQSTKHHQASSFENLGGSGAGAAVGVVLALLILVIVVVLVLVLLYWKNVFGVRDKMESSFDNIRNHLKRKRESETRPSGRTDEEAGATDETQNPLLPGTEAPVNGSENQEQDEEAGATDETQNPLLPDIEAPVNGSENQKQGKEAPVISSEKQKQDEKKIEIWKLKLQYSVHILKRGTIRIYRKSQSFIFGELFRKPILQDLFRVQKTDNYEGYSKS